MGANTGNVDLNFDIEIELGVFVKPLMLAAIRGDVEVLRVLLQNPTVDINQKEASMGYNCFQLACIYNRGQAMGFLAEQGIDIYNKSSVSGKNALHLAIERKKN